MNVLIELKYNEKNEAEHDVSKQIQPITDVSLYVRASGRPCACQLVVSYR